MEEVAGMSGRRVVGYISGVAVGVDREGVFYRFHIVTPSGQDYWVRMRVPPSWMWVGTPVTGVLVRASPSSEEYLIQDASRHTGVPETRVQFFENITVDHVVGVSSVQALLRGSSADAMVSAPILSRGVMEDAERVAGTAAYVYLAESPIGMVVVAIQSVREYMVGRRMRTFLEMLGE
ncbi:MAG: hypothetical protein QW815_08050 [Nitrososphaerota archaeon]